MIPVTSLFAVLNVSGQATTATGRARSGSPASAHAAAASLGSSETDQPSAANAARTSRARPAKGAPQTTRVSAFVLTR